MPKGRFFWLFLRQKNRPSGITAGIGTKEMSQKKQQDILSVNTALKTIPLGIVYAFSESLVFIIDTILAGHFLKEEAVAAITIALPVLVIMGSFTLMIIQGGYLKMLERMGKSDMDGYDRVYSLMIFLSIVVDLIFMGICFFVPDAVISLTGGANATAEVCALSRLYLRTSCLMLFFYIIGTAFLYKRPELRAVVHFFKVAKLVYTHISDTIPVEDYDLGVY